MCREIRFLSLLQSALDQPAADREAFVRAESDDPSLIDEVLESLAGEDDLGDFLERPAAVAAIEARAEERQVASPRRS